MTTPSIEPLKELNYIIPPTPEQAEAIQERIGFLAEKLPKIPSTRELLALGLRLQSELDMRIDVGIKYTDEVYARFDAMQALSTLAIESAGLRSYQDRIGVFIPSTTGIKQR